MSSSEFVNINNYHYFSTCGNLISNIHAEQLLDKSLFLSLIPVDVQMGIFIYGGKQLHFTGLLLIT